ncbi:hypothetical protein D3C80_2091780 [compost metagenome]
MPYMDHRAADLAPRSEQFADAQLGLGVVASAQAWVMDAGLQVDEQQGCIGGESGHDGATLLGRFTRFTLTQRG